MCNDWTIKSSEKTQGVHQNWASLESNQFKARKGDLGKNGAQPTVAPPTCHGSSTSFPPAPSVLMRTRGSYYDAHSFLPASKYRLWSKCSSDKSQNRVPFHFFSFPNHPAADWSTSESRNLTFPFMFVFVFWFPLSMLAEFLVLESWLSEEKFLELLDAPNVPSYSLQIFTRFFSSTLIS